MECLIARHHLDCLHEGTASLPADDVADREALDHADHCPACRHYLEEIRFFDRRFYSGLMSSAVPDGLEDRLLAVLDEEIAAAEQVRSSSRIRKSLSRFGLPLSVVAAFMILIAGGFFWSSSPVPLDFSDAGQRLTSRFLNSDPDQWQQLSDFDGSFNLETSRRDLRMFRLSPARGVDLGGSSAQDAAVFQFAMKNWRGVLTVLPTERFTGVPEDTTPQVQSGRRMLQWQSADGTLTYICFVHQGSPTGLAHHLFGRLA